MASPRRLVEESAVLIRGPWTHRTVSANGIRLHIAEAGSGPLVLLLHGFPEFWWSWHHQLVSLAEAGFHVVAPDLRGFGASDKPPRGYDAPTLSADLAGLVRALGEQDAVFVGHDWGGHLAWSTAALHPAVRQLAHDRAGHHGRERARQQEDAELDRGDLDLGGQEQRVERHRERHGDAGHDTDDGELEERAGKERRGCSLAKSRHTLHRAG